MRGPAGEQIPGEGVFLAVEPARRVVFTDALTADWRPRPAFMVADFAFAPEGDGTRYTATARHWTEEVLRQHEAMGFREGWTRMADQLEAVARQAGLPIGGG